MISFVNVVDFFGYLRWRKKALVAAATGKFSRTDIPDKLISGLLIAFVVLCAGIIIVKSIVTGNRELLLAMAVIAGVMISYHFLDGLKKKTESCWKKHIISAASVLIYIAAVVLVNLVS